LRRVGVMGGMFDPVHHGHLRTALSILEYLGLDEMRLVPCHHPVHRQPCVASPDQRIKMLQLAVDGDPRLVVDERECQQTGPSYFYDTLHSILTELSDVSLYFVLGADAFNSLPTWYRWREIFALTRLVVIDRPGWEVSPEQPLHEIFIENRVLNQEHLHHKAGAVLLCTMDPLDISSSKIRQLIATGKSPRYLVPDAVWHYIKANKLYH
jgi:nicotinate-nucleotide adenylyltransferase